MATNSAGKETVTPRKPHLVLIHPGPNKNRFGKKRRRKSSIAPLTLPLLAGLADADFHVTAYDEDIEDLPPQIDADFVGITAITPQANRAYELGDAFRRRGIPVIMGDCTLPFFPMRRPPMPIPWSSAKRRRSGRNWRQTCSWGR